MITVIIENYMKNRALSNTNELVNLWCTTRKLKGSSYTRFLTKLFECISYRSINNIYLKFKLNIILRSLQCLTYECSKIFCHV